MAKMNANIFITKDYENEPPSGPKKQTQFKPNFRKAKMNLKTIAKKSGHTFIFSGLIIAQHQLASGYEYFSLN